MSVKRDSIWLLVVLAISIFVTEIIIMTGINIYIKSSATVVALIDSAMLTIILFPILYFAVYRKIVTKNDALLLVERELLTAKIELEQRVEERTRQLTVANAEIAASMERLQEGYREIEILGDMAKMLQACRDFDEAFKVAEYELRRLFPEHVGALYVMKASRNQLDRVVVWGDQAGFHETVAPEDCWALRFGKPHFSSLGAQALTCAHVAAGGVDEHLCLPITAYGERLGALCLQRPLRNDKQDLAPKPPSPERLQFCATVTESLALAIANIRLREKLQHQALRDPLTGLFNRRYLVDSLERELERAGGIGQCLSVVMFDIDFFKRFNDEFGHDAGDAVLSALGVLLQKRTRATDIVARYGGEEFAVVMTDTDVDLALHRVEALREEVAVLAVRHNGRALGRISISAGISAFPGNGDNPTALFQAADAALYEAKKAGRDCVVVYRDAKPQGETTPSRRWAIHGLS